MNIQEIAEEALRKPEYFAYFGDLDEEVWGRMFSKHRDSDLLGLSNWDAICEEMSKYEHDWQVEEYNHWAVGWVVQGRVRVYDKQNNYTAGFLHAVEIWERLQEYPVLDEDDLSRRELEQAYEDLERHLPYATDRFIDGELLPDDFMERVFHSDYFEWDHEGASEKSIEDAVEDAYIGWKLEAYENKEQLCMETA